MKLIKINFKNYNKNLIKKKIKYYKLLCVGMIVISPPTLKNIENDVQDQNHLYCLNGLKL